MYQISDHYGWNGHGTESWQDSCDLRDGVNSRGLVGWRIGGA